MVDKVPNSPEDREESAALTPLEFSLPKCRYESIALFENQKEQQFLIRVSGLDESAVKKYIEELRVYLEVLPYEPIQRGDKEEPKEQKERTNQQSTQDLEITIEAIDAPDIKPPYILHFTLDPSIGLASHNYSFTDTTEARVSITAHGGSLGAELRQGGVNVDNANVDVFANLPPTNIDTLIRRIGPGASTSFQFRVTGMMNNNRYSLTGDCSMGAFAAFP